MKCAVCFVILVLGASGFSLDAEDKEWKEHPVAKVVRMLKEMDAELQHEADTEEEMYEKMSCYCETNTKEKGKAISDGEQRSAELTAAIQENSAKAATLTTEVEALNAQIAENQNSMEKAAGMRKEQNSEFNDEEKNAIVSIKGLKTAVMVLGKTHGENNEMLLSINQVLKNTMAAKGLAKWISSRQRRVISSFLQKPSFLQRQEPAGFMQENYAPASGEILGVLKQMKEEFETNYATSQKDEGRAQSDFEALKAGKNEELAAAQDQVLTKNTEIADATDKASAAKEDLAATQSQLEADSTFLAAMKPQCEALDKEFAERSKTRSEEKAAISEAISIITEDDARETMGRSLGFFQRSSTKKVASTRSVVSNNLMRVAQKAKDPRVSALAISAKLDAFGMVKDKVQAMIDDLKAEKAEEIKFKDQCNTDLHQNGVDTTAKYGEKEDLETSVADLTMQKSNLKDEIAMLEADIKNSHIEMKRASENREQENKDFQAVVADQRATQQILTKALDRLKVFYGNRAMVQVHSQGRQDPGSFQTYKKNEKSGGVMAMIANIIEDSKDLEAEALAAEQDAQAAYETFVTDSNNSIAEYSKSIAEKQASSGTVDENLVNAKADLKATLADIESLEGIGKQLHWDCDFVLQNFDIRQEARDQEVEALKSSIAMLSGAH